MGHEAADEMNIAAEAVQLGDGDVAPLFSCGGQCGLKLGPAVQRIRAYPGLYLDELTGQLKSLSAGKVAKGCPLGLDAQA